MRVVLIGASATSITTAQILTGRGNDVVIVEKDKARIDMLVDELDCGFILGDGTKPAILREAGPADSDLLLCLSNNDQDNILASLVGRSLGFPRVVTKIEDPEYEHICLELGLTDTVVPQRHLARALADLAQGREALDFSVFFKNEIRLFSFVAGEQEAAAVGDLDLPAQTKVMCLYRDNDFILSDGKTRIAKGDEVVLVTHSKHLEALHERWANVNGQTSATD